MRVLCHFHETETEQATQEKKNTMILCPRQKVLERGTEGTGIKIFIVNKDMPQPIIQSFLYLVVIVTFIWI